MEVPTRNYEADNVERVRQEKVRVERQLEECSQQVETLKKVLETLQTESSAFHMSGRIRPFFPHETARGDVQVTRSDPASRVIELDEGMGRGALRVPFDEVFDSATPDRPDTGSQQAVYERVGKPLLDFALQGFNVSLLGFGQTASGKTHTLFGDNLDRGIIPRFIADLFEAVERRHKATGAEYRIELECLEVYSEQIFNLLEGCTSEDGFVSPIPKSLRQLPVVLAPRFSQGTFVDVERRLRSRSRTPPASTRTTTPPARYGARSSRTVTPVASSPQHSPRSSVSADYGTPAQSSATAFRGSSSRSRSTTPTTPRGVAAEKYVIKGGTMVPYYVQGLIPIRVTNVNKVFNLLAIIDRQRTIAETRMNRQSSRAHTLFRLFVKRTEGTRVLSSRVCLVDLAGSENIKISGAEGVTAHEAISINKSLTVLAHCLSLRSKGGSKIQPPYNTCTLTKLLKETLEGNARTHMVITLAPNSGNSPASASALRFSKMCRTVRSKPKCNLETDEPYADQLQKCIDELRAQLSQHEGANQDLKDKILELEEYLGEAKRREQWQSEGGPASIAFRQFITAQERVLLEIERAYFGDEQVFCLTGRHEAADARRYYQQLASKEMSRLASSAGPRYWLELLDPETEEDDQVYKMLSDVFQWSCSSYASEFQLYRLQLRVCRIERVHNPALRAAFYKCKAGLHAPQGPSVLRFYGGEVADVEPILRDGFKLPDPRKFNTFGAGLHFSTNATKAALSTSDVQHQLIVCEVALGKVMQLHEAIQCGLHQLSPDLVNRRGYDSVFANRGKSLIDDEYVILQELQALPAFVITYRIEAPESADARKLANVQSINLALEETVERQKAELETCRTQIRELLRQLPSTPVFKRVEPVEEPPQKLEPAVLKRVSSVPTESCSMGTSTDTAGLREIGTQGEGPTVRHASMGTDPYQDAKKKRSKCNVM
eukprot:TRINITY_DN13235_c0_g1_i1.p1 TRINITY_DN13235_c0_g1~~TRINITY_DN13235_c0_g1_i1.p1  ORF type:complete len:946 (+),score=128.41 TRINITY_DN13235_c0_g1_i1:38-2875(+)